MLLKINEHWASALFAGVKKWANGSSLRRPSDVPEALRAHVSINLKPLVGRIFDSWRTG